MEMDGVSQAMIDGCANYAGDPEVEARCHDCTASIDRHIDERIAAGGRLRPTPRCCRCSWRAGLSDAQVRANVKLAISGGQNEPRDAIAGTAWALLTHPGQRALIEAGEATWADGLRGIRALDQPNRHVAAAASRRDDVVGWA
jgi:cytochrome P450